MAKNDYMKGITVELGGDATGLDKALSQVNKSLNSTQSELKQVDKLLKLDPGNLTLTKQKQDLLKESISQTKDKLDALKQAQSEVKAKFQSGEIDGGQYRNFQRELEQTNQSLKDLKDQKSSVSVIGKAFQEAKSKAQELQEKLSPLENGLKKVGSAAKTITSAGIKTVGTAVSAAETGLKAYTGAALAAGTAVAAFGIKGIQTASDLSEVQNVVDTTFGKDSTAIDDWSQKASKAYGLSVLSAKQYNGTMGAMLKSTGVTQEQVTEMSTSLVGLTGDMASFYNLDGQEAFDKLRAGISGETEPLKALGINMSAANLEAFALSQGITKSYQSMSQAEQTTLRYNFIMSATKDAQGDFAKTSGGLANQLRVLQLQGQNLAASFGSALLPAVTGMLGGVVDFADKATPALGKVFSGFAGLLTGASGAKTQFSAGLDELIKMIAGKTSAMIPQIIGVVSTALPALLGGFNTIILGGVDALVAALPGMVNVLLPVLITCFMGLVEGLLPQVPVVLPLLVQGAMTLFTGLIDGLNQVTPQLMTMLPILIQQVSQTLINNLPLIVSGGVQLLVSLISGIAKSVPQLITQIVALIPVMTKALTDNLPALIAAGISLIVALAQGLPKAIPAIIKALPEIINAIIDGLMKVDWAKVGIDILSGIVMGLFEGVKSIGAAVGQIGSKIMSAFKNYFGIHSPSTMFRDQIGKFMAQGIGVGFTGEMQDVTSSMKKAIPQKFYTDARAATQSVQPITQPAQTGGFRDFVLSINNFNNYRQQDVQQLMRESEYYLRAASLARGGA